MAGKKIIQSILLTQAIKDNYTEHEKQSSPYQIHIPYYYPFLKNHP